VVAEEQVIRRAGDKHEAAFLAELIREGRDLANLQGVDNALAATPASADGCSATVVLSLSR